VGEVTPDAIQVRDLPFNSAVEIGLRALCVLSEAYPAAYSLQRLVVFDYMVVHSDDLPGGPPGLHPQTPNRSGEILVRRETVQAGLRLYQSRGLILDVYRDDGLFFTATERAAAFLDALATEYVQGLRDRSEWVVQSFGMLDDQTLENTVRAHLGEWGAEFTLQSVLWSEEA
jgi:hypothetical protein